MKQGILKFLGNEAGFGNNNNSAYIEINDKFVLIDCGLTVFEKLKNNFDFNKYNSINVIITHLHNDHVGSLSQFILYLWFVYNKKTTVISKCKNIKKYLQITGTTKQAYKVIDNFDNIKFIKTLHVKELDSYGFKAKYKGRTFIYTGDTKTIVPFLEYMNDVNELYIDTSKYGGVHIKFEEVIETLREIKSKGIEIFLMHIDDYEYIRKINNNEFYFA